MKKLKYVLTSLLLITSFLGFSQGRPQMAKIKITGKVIEKTSKQALEYATITLTNPNFPKATTSGGITNPKGEFNIDISPETYDIKIEFISFKPIIIKGRSLRESTNLGEIALEEEASQLNEVVIRSEKTTIDIKLDKKVYNIGNDLIVKGGTVSDVLDNIPSVSVNAEGTISLRGNKNVTIFIDGMPSNAVNVNEALRLISADAIEKVEVITNPSSRYDAEGGAGILNIILKKGKNKGINAALIAASGYPETNSISGTLNYKTKHYNLFTNQGYSYRNNPGNAFIQTEYLNPKPNSPEYIEETRKIENKANNYNGNLGLELYVNESTSWTNSINYRNSDEAIVENIKRDKQYANSATDYTQTRANDNEVKNVDVAYKSSFRKKFKKDGHKLNAFVQIGNNYYKDLNNITDSDNKSSNDNARNIQNIIRQLYQLDYVLPTGKAGQFEAGYRGSFTDQKSDAVIYNGAVLNTDLTNNLEYIEKINAIYSQYGFKKNKFSYLFGLRWENSNIHVNQLTSNDFNHKKYNNIFPSAFLTYEISKESSLSLNYSRRITRPRGSMINPFGNFTSNINISKGNPDLDPSMTDAIDFGFLKKWDKILFNTSIYTNNTKDVVIYTKMESGDFVNGVPVFITKPINLATEFRTGFELNLNYTPYKWWRLNSNFNFFNIDTKGDYTYTDFNDQVVTQNFDNNASSWSAKLNSKVTLPNKIDWQTNMNYTGDQNTAQGKILGVFAMNLGFSKDVMKDKGTFAFTINDVFNSRKRKVETLIPNVIQSYGEMQFSQRQFTLSFTYRFNKAKNEKEKDPNNGNGDDF
ncbi:outer membrane beta-barrel family protein [Flavobacterium undicola]|uniref:outer membrane beta-barrel family protein n=1 Tax=Flavobacterium undicola TaxID=1932779 RepID=UPI0013781730|nr:outer membrane beta-barrel family protein [Flavobacterium undicola]MBA0882468.1 TonB-dependent receptor [Flavobacterium undicola]